MIDPTQHEIVRLRKALAFNARRRDTFEHDMREMRIGATRFIVNGLSSRDMSHLMYLANQRDNILDRLRELHALTHTEQREWDAFVHNWLPRVGRDAPPSICQRLARAGLIEGASSASSGS